MIRHSSSFFISIIVHLTLLIGVYFAWSSSLDTKEEHQEESVCLQLCNVKYEQEAVDAKKEPKKNEQPKKPIEQKVQKRVEEPPKPKLAKKEVVIDKVLPEVPEIQETEAVKELNTEEEKSVVKEQEKRQEVVATVQKKMPAEPEKKVQEPKNEQSIKVDATQEYLKINTQKISELIRENLYYPMAARKRNITGRVSIKFTLCSSGEVNNIKIIDSSSDILSRAAIRTIEELSEKFPKPGINIILTLPIDYRLN